MKPEFLMLAVFLCGVVAWWDPAATFHASKAVIAERLSLIVNATRLTYVSTQGSYYEPWTANDTIGLGWLRFAEANPAFGMHAIAFFHPVKALVLVAFRGTDFNTSTASGRADICADAYLFNETVPAYCDDFSAAVLDYAGSARAFANSVRATLPQARIMYTGHSLGAALAAMLTLYRFEVGCAPTDGVAGAVIFASPDFLYAMVTHSHVDLDSIAVVPAGAWARWPARILSLVDAYDPIHVAAQSRPGRGMLGHLCTWNLTAPSSACIQCDSSNATNQASSDCLECFYERHYFGHYVKLAGSGHLPTCGIVSECERARAACNSREKHRASC